ncbi:(2Fe-2S)-binding protein [Ancylobacter pratisalsi]|uniref:Bacterioferritin-associated ferredoxin n=1 Tax=Ancylobacter pratisalsi TaxID=1745854 RepID=A0A6P1YPM5_9HYPH|nr:(2Fe-2S)-binding protein [Ancylobacter pratisalsi]QIB35025.1 (2Fe-2S)-binding protein [Ancylobacter pratisalsi]
MIVCSCNVISDRQIRDAVNETQPSVRTAGQVYRCLGCSAQCGRCARMIRKLIDDVNASACGACPRECPVAGHSHNHNHSHPPTHLPTHAAVPAE